MEEGLFEKNERRGRCTCFEKAKPLAMRSLTIRSYYPSKVWGRAKEGYDGRKLLAVKCNRCGKVWKEYGRNSRFWALIDDTPDSAGERLVTRNTEET